MTQITPAQKAARNANAALGRVGYFDSATNRKMIVHMRQLVQNVIDTPWVGVGVLLPGDYVHCVRRRGPDLVYRPSSGGRRGIEPASFEIGRSHSMLLDADRTSMRIFADALVAGWLDDVSGFLTARDGVLRDLRTAVFGPR